MIGLIVCHSDALLLIMSSLYMQSGLFICRYSPVHIPFVK